MLSRLHWGLFENLQWQTCKIVMAQMTASVSHLLMFIDGAFQL
jgi:hypothetical protein